MQKLDIHNRELVQFVNAAELIAGNEGLIPRRFPQADMDAFGVGMGRIAAFSTAVELQLHGRINELRVQLYVRDNDSYGIFAECFRGPGKLLPTFRLDPESTAVQTLHVRADGNTDYHWPLRLILPTHCTVEIIAVEVDAAAELQVGQPAFSYNQLQRAKPLTWVAHGDSIVQGANITCPSSSWVNLAALTLGVHAVNLGIGGFGTAEAAVAAYLARRQDMDLLSLNLGVNAVGNYSESEFGARFGEFMAPIRAAQPLLPIVVVSPIWSFRDNKSDGKNAQDIRDAMQNVCQQYIGDGDANLIYVDGREFDFNCTNLRADHLHLSESGAIHYRDQMLPLLQPIVSKLRQ